MLCEIKWNSLDLTAWEERFATIRRSTLTQSYPYAQANAAINKQRPRWGVIMIDGMEAGFVQIFEASLIGKLIHAVMIDCGPLWFEGFGNEAHQAAFWERFNSEFPKRFGRKRRIIPVTPYDLTRHNFKQERHQYDTIWIDLTLSEEVLRKRLKKNWRGSLQKAEKSDLTITWDEKGEQLGWLLQHYAADRIAKNYGGASAKMLKTLAQYALPRGACMTGQALYDGEPVAGILIFRHGSSATYQIGYTDEVGRQHGAHHLLLWNAMTMLKTKGIKDLDLGGIDETHAKGVSAFKLAMGGERVTVPCTYS